MVDSLSDLLSGVNIGGVNPLAFLASSSAPQTTVPQASPIDPTGASALPAAASGNVLAKLRTGAPTPPAVTVPHVFSGAPDVRGMSRGAAFASGLSGGLGDASKQGLLAQNAQSQNFQNNLDLYKTMFAQKNTEASQAEQAKRDASLDAYYKAQMDPELQGKLATAKEKEESSTWQQIGEDEWGHKEFGYPPAAPKSDTDATESGKKPDSSPGMAPEDFLKAHAAGGMDAAVGMARAQRIPGVESVSGDKTPDLALPDDQQARLMKVSPMIRGAVNSILQGRMTMPQITGRMSPFTGQLTKAVFDVNPDFDAANNRTQVSTRKAYSPSGNNNSPGVLIQNGDAALDHLAELKDASDKLANYGSLIGGAVNAAANVTGGRVGHDYSQAMAELDTKAQIASAEAIKYLAGATGGGEGERNTLMAKFSSGTPPDSRVAAMHGLAQDILQKKLELQAGWHRSMDAKGLPAPDFDVISPNSQKSIAKLGLGNWASNGDRLDQTPIPAAPVSAPAATSPASAAPKIRVYNASTGALE